eukprot:TRINITY_DN19657_c0_g1_i1.p1 TRINITY_DN19657_c0_g1~~TRINITY_DN19657_c0_g1_i1.p1  ORF type:complete len:198 (+),score=18.04 TRINITY_DN19657_c0_g1_i1:145-738(+)
MRSDDVDISPSSGTPCGDSFLEGGRESPSDVVSRSLQHMKDLRSAAESSRDDASVFRAEGDSIRKALIINRSFETAHENAVKQLAEVTLRAAGASARAEQCERIASHARHTRDQVRKDACHAGAGYAGLCAEAVWLRRLIQRAQKDEARAYLEGPIEERKHIVDWTSGVGAAHGAPARLHTYCSCVRPLIDIRTGKR